MEDCIKFPVVLQLLNEEFTNNGPKLTLKKPLWHGHLDGRSYLSLEAEKYLKWFHSRQGDFENISQETYIDVLSLVYEIEL